MSKERSSDPKKQPREKKPPATPSRGQGAPGLQDFEEIFGKYQLPKYQAPANKPPATPSRGQGGPGLQDFEEILKKYQLSAGNQPPAEKPLPTDASAILQQFGVTPIAKLSPPVRPIDLSRSHVTSVREQGTAETFLSEERRTYPNKSKGKMTKNISVSNSVTRTVTIETGKLTSNNANAGVTLVGFAAIQGQVQRQLDQHYSVATESSVTIGESTTIEIPPASTVEHVIRWKLISIVGIAVLGETPRFSPSFDLAEVPYRIPLRLTYTETLNDIPHLR